jgi:hypothetical protein
MREVTARGDRGDAGESEHACLYGDDDVELGVVAPRDRAAARVLAAEHDHPAECVEDDRDGRERERSEAEATFAKREAHDREDGSREIHDTRNEHADEDDDHGAHKISSMLVTTSCVVNTVRTDRDARRDRVART